ncbi:hypothetical protein EC957_009642 [Mortierella hygrophila]|uniref:Uncharacterized protein n=1 Tax=Mortierella hygrophila TaxID=979708 RepID=A0A9P6K4J9_9FUNG|nr:hypothetical protein EC957_009642 [Mortierella hygrophila]
MEQQNHVNALSNVLMTFLRAMEMTVNKRVEEKLAARVEEEMPQADFIPLAEDALIKPFPEI